jgi:hypothetical protein
MQKSATAAVELIIPFMPPDPDDIMTQISKGVKDHRKCSHGGMCTPKRCQVVLGQEKGEGGASRLCPFFAGI